MPRIRGGIFSRFPIPFHHGTVRGKSSALVSASLHCGEVDSPFGSGFTGFGNGLLRGIFTLSTAVHRNRVSLVAPGGEVADHGEGCVASEAPQRRDGARQIQRRGERDGCPVDQSEDAYRIGLAEIGRAHV